MNVRDGFVAAATKEIAVPADFSIGEFQGGVFGKFEVAGLQEYSYLHPPYQYLLLSAIRNVRKAIDPDHPVQKATAAGMLIMTKFLTSIPYVYDQQRENFGEMPADSGQQVEELGRIAANSTEVITYIARQHMQVAAPLERTQCLRDAEMPQIEARDNCSYMFQLQEHADGLHITTRFGLEGQIKTAKDQYNRTYSKPLPPRALGCMALKLQNPETGENVFDMFWRQFVDAAVSQPTLFAADLARLQQQKHLHSAYL